MPSKDRLDIAYRYLCDDAPVLLMLLDRSGRVIEANRRAAAVFGGNPLGRAFRELVIDFRGTLDPAALAADESRLHPLDVGDGEHPPHTWYFRFSRLADQVLVLAHTDLDQQQRLQDEILALNRELSNLARELHQANAELTRLNRQKNEFLGMAAHDLRGPLHQLVLAARRLRVTAGESLTPGELDLLARMEDTCGKMRRRIDGFLDYAVIESGRLRLQCEPTGLRELLADACDLLRPDARDKGVRLDLHCPAEFPRLMLDGPKISQVIDNLLQNAIHHAPAGTAVTVECAADGARARVAVRDAGKGISLEHQARLFHAFERPGAAAPASHGSIGLGLAIARRIVEAHGGTIEVESRPGEGATFRFYLPLEPCPESN